MPLIFFSHAWFKSVTELTLKRTVRPPESVLRKSLNVAIREQQR